MQGVNRSLQRSSASSSHETFLNIQHRQKAELKRVIDFLQDQYEGLASELASKQLELKVAKSRRMPSESFELRNIEYETKSEINQLKFKHMTQLQETMAQHQLQVDVMKNQFQQKMQRQYQNFKRQFAKLKKQSSGKLEQEIMQLSQKNMQLNRELNRVQIKLRESQKRVSNSQTQSQIKQLKKLVSEKQIQISRLQRQLKQSQQYTEQIKHKLSQKNKQIDYFVNQMNRDKSMSRSTFIDKANPLSTKQQKTTNADISELSDQLIFIKEQNDRIRKINDKYKNAVTEKQTQIQQLNTKIISLNKQIKSQNLKIETLNQQIKQYQTGKKIFESEMARLNDNIQKNMGQIIQKQTELKTLNFNIQKLKQDNSLINDKVSDQDLERKRLEDIISRQNEKLGNLQDQIRNFTIKVHKKQQQIIELNKVIDNNKSQYKGLQIAFQSKQNQYQIVSGQNRQYLHDNQGLKNQLNDQKRSHDELKHKLHKIQEDNNDLLQSLKQLKIQYQNVRIQNSTLKQFQNACGHLKDQISQLQHQLKLAKDELRKEIEETYRYKLDLESTLVELNEAQQKLKEVEAQKMDFADRNQLVEQLRKYVQVIENTSNLNNQLNNQIKNLKQNNNRLTQQKISMEKRLDRAEQKTMKSRTVEKGSSIGQLQSQITRLQLSVNNLENQKRFFQEKALDQAKQKDKTISTLQKQLADISETSRQKQDQIKDQFDSLYRFSIEAKQQIQTLKNQLNSATLQNTKIKNSHKAQSQIISVQIQGLKEQIKRKNHENENLNKRLHSLKQQQMQRYSSDKQMNIVLQSQLSASKTKLQLTEFNLKDRQGQIQRLNNKYQKVISQKESIEIQLDKIKIQQWKQRGSLENTESEKQSLLKQLKSKQVIFHQQLQTLKSDNQELISNNEQLTEYVKDLQKQRNRLEMDNQMLSQGYQKFQKERNSMKQQLSKIDLDLASARVQNQSLKRKKPEIQSPKSAFNQALKFKQQYQKQRRLKRQLEEQNQKLRSQINNTSTIVIKQKEQKRRDQNRQYELQSSSSNNYQLQNQIKRLNQQIRLSGIEFNQLLKYRSDLQMKLIQTGDELRKVRQQLAYKNGGNQGLQYGGGNDYEASRMMDHIRELEMRNKLIEDVNAQMRKKQFQQQEKVTRILADNKSQITHYRLENNRLQKQNTDLQVRIKQLQQSANEIMNQNSNKNRNGGQQIGRLREELKNVYSQVHTLNNILIQKQGQIDSLLNRGKQPMSFGSLQHISSPKQKKTLKNTEDCWKDMQSRIKAGQKQFNKTKAFYN